MGEDGGIAMVENTSRRFRPFHLREEPAANLGELAKDVVRALETEHPELLGYLVWTPDRLDMLTDAVEQIIEGCVVDLPELKPLIRRSVVNQITGLGPLDELLLDDSVTEIMINRPEEVVVERGGCLEAVPSQFVDEAEVRSLAQRLAARAGRSLTTESPMVDARLSDGSRISAIIPPVSQHTIVAIRRALDRPPVVEDLLATGALTEEAWRYLVQAVRDRRNSVIAGGAGAGKTHLLRLLAAEIPEPERLVAIEDVRELQLTRSGVISLEAGGRYTIHDLFVQALRLRPDRILVGEVRAGEALDLIEAMGSGHPGSLTTVHSPGPGIDTIYRLARAALRSGTPFGFEAICEQIMRTVDVIVFTGREPNGKRGIWQIDVVDSLAVYPVFVRRGGTLSRVDVEPVP